jgi:hypothetical protein
LDAKPATKFGITSKAAQPGTKGFQKGVSGNPKGRPKGRRNKATVLAQALFDDNCEAIAERIIDLALKKGDLTALKICIDRLVPPIKSRPLSFTLPQIKTARDIVAGHAAVLTAVSRGQLTLEEVRAMADLLEGMRRAMDMTELEERLARIEARLEASP